MGRGSSWQGHHGPITIHPTQACSTPSSSSHPVQESLSACKSRGLPRLYLPTSVQGSGQGSLARALTPGLGGGGGGCSIRTSQLLFEHPMGGATLLRDTPTGSALRLGGGRTCHSPAPLKSRWATPGGEKAKWLPPPQAMAQGHFSGSWFHICGGREEGGKRPLEQRTFSLPCQGSPPQEWWDRKPPSLSEVEGLLPRHGLHAHHPPNQGLPWQNRMPRPTSGTCQAIACAPPPQGQWGTGVP